MNEAFFSNSEREMVSLTTTAARCDFILRLVVHSSSAGFFFVFFPLDIFLILSLLLKQTLVENDHFDEALDISQDSTDDISSDDEGDCSPVKVTKLKDTNASIISCPNSSGVLKYFEKYTPVLITISIIKSA